MEARTQRIWIPASATMTWGQDGVRSYINTARMKP